MSSLAVLLAALRVGGLGLVPLDRGRDMSTKGLFHRVPDGCLLGPSRKNVAVSARLTLHSDTVSVCRIRPVAI
ncbi:hypothetical protein F4818DRAFT_434100 [Hypoxylon cercidicola]|nr:hypothetical protein F4818DRAFT_434100 [Hypoxylon cercidicola]